MKPFLHDLDNTAMTWSASARKRDNVSPLSSGCAAEAGVMMAACTIGGRAHVNKNSIKGVDPRKRLQCI